MNDDTIFVIMDTVAECDALNERHTSDVLKRWRGVPYSVSAQDFVNGHVYTLEMTIVEQENMLPVWNMVKNEFATTMAKTHPHLSGNWKRFKFRKI